MTNSWILHVKKYAADNNIAFACAIATPECKNSYTKKVKLTKKEKEQQKRDIVENQSLIVIKNKIKNMEPLDKNFIRMNFNSYSSNIKDKFKAKFPNYFNKLFD